MAPFEDWEESALLGAPEDDEVMDFTPLKERLAELDEQDDCGLLLGGAVGDSTLEDGEFAQMRAALKIFIKEIEKIRAVSDNRADFYEKRLVAIEQAIAVDDPEGNVYEELGRAAIRKAVREMGDE